MNFNCIKNYEQMKFKKNELILTYFTKKVSKFKDHRHNANFKRHTIDIQKNNMSNMFWLHQKQSRRTSV